MHLRNRLYDRGWKASYRAPVPVVSIGNLTLGGTGKTPCVAYVAGFFRRWKRRVAILSRGYGGTGGLNDEALVLAENLPDVPHLQGPDRVALATAAVRDQRGDVLVLDDGFQHRRLARDLDVVLVDATLPWGHGHLFPRGLLRERPTSLRRAGVVVLTRCDQVAEPERRRLRESVLRIAPHAQVAETVHRPLDLINGQRTIAPLDRLRDRPVVAFCGIGNPAAFQQTLTGLGLTVAAFRPFPDHHAYPRTDIEALIAWALRQARDCIVVTTQKDLVKLRRTHLGDRELWALRICLAFEAGQETFDQKLRDVIRARCVDPLAPVPSP
jgi:tetraacyldisaccharide 4'-kinase